MVSRLGATGAPLAVLRQGPLVKVLATRDFKRSFFGSLSRQIRSLTIVSPYVTPVPGFASTFEFFRHLTGRMPDASLDLVTSPPNDNRRDVMGWQEAELIEQLGVSLMIRPSRLHSKVYYVRYPEGDTSSFVGSANFTKGGFDRNYETIAHWRRSDPDAEVERELARLTGRGSFNLIQWKLNSNRNVRYKEADDGD